MTGPARASRPRPGRPGNHNHDERGMTLAFVAIGFAGLFAASILAIDLGVLMTARSQAQNSADAGAHAGAVALAFEDYNDRSATGPAVRTAIERAQANLVMGGAVSVTPADIDFPVGPTGISNRVRVRVYRTAERGNPVNTFIAAIANLFPWGTTDTVDVGAVAVAEASPADTVDCILPFMIPDRWNERTQPPFHSIDSTYDLYDRRGNPLPTPDEYVPITGGDSYTGYKALPDKGTPVTLKTDNESKVSPSIYFPIVVPGNGTGANAYENAIAECTQATFTPGQDVTVEPGNMVGPTRQGIDRLVAKDPDAYWDTDCNCVKGSAYGTSPRVRAIPLYNPHYYETNKQTGRNAAFQVANFLGVFVEGMVGNEVRARIVPIVGKVGNGAGPVPSNAFPMAIRIVE